MMSGEKLFNVYNKFNRFNVFKLELFNSNATQNTIQIFSTSS